MELSEKSFQILDALDRHEIFSQRQLAKHSGVSLAQVNYLLKRLLEKGLVRVKNFQKNPNKSTYLYLLTGKGLEAKSQVAVRFVKSRLKEYNHLKDALTKKLTSIERTSPVRVISVGPLKDLKEIDSESFDVALLFDGNAEGVKKISNHLNIPMNKFAALW